MKLFKITTSQRYYFTKGESEGSVTQSWQNSHPYGEWIIKVEEQSSIPKPILKVK
jgi:hypothetical protein